MEAHVDAGMLFEEFDERQVGLFVGPFEHVAKITTRLVRVDEQDEMEALWHGDNVSLKHHTVRCNFSDS